jgi:alpha-glucosidase
MIAKRFGKIKVPSIPDSISGDFRIFHCLIRLTTYETPMKLLPLLAACFITTISLHAQSITASSPDSALQFRLTIEDTDKEQGCIFYSLSYRNHDVVLRSRLGVVTVDLPYWINGFAPGGQTRRSINETWAAVCGERRLVQNQCNEVTCNLVKDKDTNTTLQLVVRVFNEGAAFCYRFPENLSTSVLHIKDEMTEFTFAEGTLAYVTPYAQEQYLLRPIKDWAYGPDYPDPLYAPRTPEYQSERPLTLVLPNGLFAVLGEARLVDYPRMKFGLSREKSNTIVSRLFGPVTESSPFTSPWRVIMVATKPGDLLEHNDIFLNLNAPSAITDPGWIRPGKVMREVTLSTTGARECIDFCAKHNIQYVEFDAGWYGYEYSKSSDASVVDVDPRRNPRKDLDLPGVISYAKSKGIGVFLYVNHRALEQQLDEVFPLYQQWGIAGLKFGFVHVGSHKWSSWVHEAVRKAATYHLLVDIHDEYRPTGYSRTYPNLLTQEGVHGNECMPDANHNTILPFTRCLAGATDYTICYYQQAGIKPNARCIKTTSAHQLALAVVFYSPLQFVFWYDRPSDCHDEPEVGFFDHVPTTWDTTKVVLGDIGQQVAIARKKGDAWFVGAITNNDGRKMEIPLAFLESGRTYTATIYTDGGDAVATRTHVKIERRKVESTTVLRTELRPSGGLAMEIQPAEKAR